MSAPKGNKFWEARSTHGRKPKFKTKEDLWDAACQYFEWVEANPLMSSELVKFQGEATVSEVPKMRAMTIQGLCLFIDLTNQGLNEYGEKEDFSEIVTRIKDVIYQQKFSGAAADLLNSNIIARDLGLTDKKQVDGDVLNPLAEVIKEISGNTLGPSSSK